ncbi:CKLF-like MARVEL transmembrane domain-containing protein 8 [Osmerus eperlanus]|uniref:CKLF-like MARVEL transmembrane domain-containing protein 8 n=1 Tax=Osmerus eperlanus TaxID=29151 RepID=UPI002E0E2871
MSPKRGPYFLQKYFMQVKDYAKYNLIRLCFPLLSHSLPYPRTLSFLFLSSPQVFGLLLWTLSGGSDYSLIPGFGWVMFVAVMYWVLTVVLLLAGLTETKIRNPTLHMQGLCFNASATVLYLVSAAVETAFERKLCWMAIGTTANALVEMLHKEKEEEG